MIFICDCCKIESDAGDEFYLPTGWIRLKLAITQRALEGRGQTSLPSKELHICHDCGSYMSFDEILEAAVELLRANAETGIRPSPTPVVAV